MLAIKKNQKLRANKYASGLLDPKLHNHSGYTAILSQFLGLCRLCLHGWYISSFYLPCKIWEFNFWHGVENYIRVKFYLCSLHMIFCKLGRDSQAGRESECNAVRL